MLLLHRVGAQGGADGAAVDHLQRHGQRAVAHLHGQAIRLGPGELAGDLALPVRDARWMRGAESTTLSRTIARMSPMCARRVIAEDLRAVVRQLES